MTIKDSLVRLFPLSNLSSKLVNIRHKVEKESITGTFKLKRNHYKPDYKKVQTFGGYKVSYHVKRIVNLLKNENFLNKHFPNIKFNEIFFFNLKTALVVKTN